MLRSSSITVTQFSVLIQPSARLPYPSPVGLTRPEYTRNYLKAGMNLSEQATGTGGWLTHGRRACLVALALVAAAAAVLAQPPDASARSCKQLPVKAKVLSKFGDRYALEYTKKVPCSCRRADPGPDDPQLADPDLHLPGVQARRVEEARRLLYRRQGAGEAPLSDAGGQVHARDQGHRGGLRRAPSPPS